MNEYNRRLQSTFLFDNADLRANRSGRLSPRQQARLQATAGSQRLVLLVFAVVLAAGLVFILLFGTASDGGNELSLQTALLAIAATGGTLLIGYLISQPFLLRSGSQQAMLATGTAIPGRVKPEAARFEILIGAARLRLSTEEHFRAFEPGVEYRLFYLPGPVAMILSGEVIGTEAESDPVPGEAAALLADDVVLGRSRSARWVIIGLGLLVIAIPAAGYAAAALPGGLRAVAYAGLLGIAIGFTYWALKRLK